MSYSLPWKFHGSLFFPKFVKVRNTVRYGTISKKYGTTFRSYLEYIPRVATQGSYLKYILKVITHSSYLKYIRKIITQGPDPGPGSRAE